MKYLQSTLKSISVVALTVVVYAFPDSVVAGSLWEGAGCEGRNCGLCEVVALGNETISWLVSILFVIFALVIVVVGFRFLTSSGNPGDRDRAKKLFMNALIGIVIVLASWIVINTLMVGVTGGTLKLGDIVRPWNQIECVEQPGLSAVTVTLDAVESYEQAFGSIAGCSDAALSISQKQSIGCTVNDCSTADCLISCANVQTGDDGTNYCVSDNRPPLADASGPVVAAGECTADTCAPLTVPCKDGANCNISPDMVSRIAGMHDGASVSGARVTEGYPPTREHKSQCHYNGTCIDYSKAGGMTSSEVLSVYNAAVSNGLRPVYEVTSASRKQELVNAGVPEESVKNLGSWISAEHFSIYGY